MSDASQRTLDLYPRLLSYALNYKRYFLISFAGFLLFAAMQTLLFKTIELFINLLEGKPTEWIAFLPESLENSIYLLPIAVLVLSGLRGIGYYFGNYYISQVGLHVVNTLRKEVFDHMLFLPQRFYDKRNSGEQISLIIYNIEQVSASVTRAVRILFEDGLFLIGLLTYMLYENWQLTLAFLGAAPILSGLVFIASRYFRRISRHIQKTVGLVSHITNEAVQGIHTVKSYNAEHFESERFHGAADSNLKYSKKFERVNALQTPIMHFVISIALALIFLLVLLLWPEGQAGAAVAFVSAAGATAKPVKQLSTINSIIQRGLAAAESIFGVLDEEREKNTGTRNLTRAEGSIRFDKLEFAYEDKPVIHALDLSIAAGETVALVGHSGSGKSTLASLLLRFYSAQRGEIYIDEQAIADIALPDLRRNIALVSQQAVLFDASVLDNVCYGASADRARAEQALKDANAYDFVMAMEDGLDTAVGEGGSRLSGGQRQRVAIARALYKDAPILILDEATSALDNESEKLIQEALNRLKQGRTTLIIAHRLSTVRDADNIVVLDHGRIVEQGTHAHLLAQGGAYANLYHTQGGH